MLPIQRISVIGLGAIGSAYASKLLEWGEADLRVVVDADRKARYERQPIEVNGQAYEFHYVTPDEVVEPADFIIIATKYDGLEEALTSLKNHVKPDTIFLSLLNGLASEEMIEKVYGPNVLPAMCIAIDAVRTGLSTRFSGIGRIVFGHPEKELYREQIERVSACFEAAGIPYEVPADILKSMWWKFMINVGLNQTSAVLQAPYGVFQQVEVAHDLMVQTMQEVVQLAQSVGVDLSPADIRAFEPILQGLSPNGKTSMLQDIESNRRTEVDYLGGYVVKLGERHRVPTPMNRTLLSIIRALEEKTSAQL